MSRAAWNLALGGLLAIILAGCNDFDGGLPVGGVVEVEQRADHAAPVDQVEQPAPDIDRRQRIVDRGHERRSRLSDPLPSETERWGVERRRPSDTLPSRTVHNGPERTRPSDSLPSKTGNWGKDRRMPSESLPSRTERWGKDRRMPSDSLPSKSPLRTPLPSESRD